ncbi:MAG: rane protein [Bacteroidetes bacterium]|jgi:lycopene cyclase domain-containing protein|nr:rane protein [Bacteroidota bacterium]MDF2450664.1 rane protein [Bacteroidota bacterium]
MNSHYTYLLLELTFVFLPLALSFHKKIAFYKLWEFLFPAMFTSTVFFISWGMFFTSQGIKRFNPDYISGIYLFNLPLEEVLFFICIPYTCVFIYEVLNVYVKRDVIGTCGTRVSILLSVLSLIACLIFYDRTLTLVNAGICIALILSGTFIYRFRNLGRFYLSFVVSLIPFLIFSGFVSGLPIVSYDNSESMNIRLGTIPLEEIFFCLGLMLSTVLIMDYLKERAEEKNT